MMSVPTWFRFNPTDEELIDILIQKVSGNTAMLPSLYFIAERNIYEVEPQHLQWTESVGLNKNERYYYCKRETDSREVRDLGWWKVTSHVKTICDEIGQALGYKRPLTFYRFRDNQRKRREAIKTDWIMHEYALHSIPTEWRLCRIKYNGTERLEENNIISPPLTSSEAGSGINNPLQLHYFASEEDHQQQPSMPPLPVNSDHENYFQRIYDELMIDDDQQQQPFSSTDIPSSSIPILTPPTPSNYQFAQQDDQSDSGPMEMEQQFPDLWPWETWRY